MLVMGLDTALQRCSVAILRDGAVLAERSAGMERGHAEHLAPMAKAVLDEAGVSVTDLDRVGVVIGPGGFTGVRVALSFARGLVIGTDVPAVGVNSLAALAANVEAPKDVLIAPVIDARRGQVYAALYDSSLNEKLSPFVAAPEETFRRLLDAAGSKPAMLVGTGAALLGKLPAGWSQTDAPDQIDAGTVARLAMQVPLTSGPPSPLYLRPPDAKPPKPSQLKKRAP